jgi:cytochrome P450
MRHEQETRELVTRLIDGFVESGGCDFMSDFARPLPGLVFFEMFLHAPSDELEEINALATLASQTSDPAAREARKQIIQWIDAFIDARQQGPRRDDVVDAILHATIEGRPITRTEMLGVIQILLFGGLDTTAGALGMMMLRFCEEPWIADLLRERPELQRDAIEELLRLDGPFAFIARTAMADTEVGGCPIAKGDKVLLSWVSANRDEDEFPDPDAFDLDRTSNRHIAFGAGPHRCAGSNLARMNLRIAVSELLRRLGDIGLAPGAEPVRFHSGFSRTPTTLPITFTPGAREGGPVAAASA